MGNAAGSGATGASDAIFIGRNAGLTATGAIRSYFIGQSAGSVASGASDSYFFGNASGFHATNALGSVFVGTRAGFPGHRCPSLELHRRGGRLQTPPVPIARTSSAATIRRPRPLIQAGKLDWLRARRTLTTRTS
ncbi:MAG: hypothetical protein WDN09_02670 [bacterium]